MMVQDCCQSFQYGGEEGGSGRNAGAHIEDVDSTIRRLKQSGWAYSVGERACRRWRLGHDFEGIDLDKAVRKRFNTQWGATVSQLKVTVEVPLRCR